MLGCIVHCEVCRNELIWRIVNVSSPKDIPTVLAPGFTRSTTQTVTNTVSATTTFTELASMTENAPQATLYAACAENNIIGAVNSAQDIVSASIASGDTILQVAAPSPYECCVACFNAENCGSTCFGNAGCYLIIQAERCSPSNQAFGYGLTGGTNRAFARNGRCGRGFLA